MQFISSAPSKSSGKGNGLAKLPEDQRKCVIAKFQSSHEVLVKSGSIIFHMCKS